MKLNNKTAFKLGVLAIDTRHRALDRAADLLSEAARILDAALVRDGEF